MLKYTKWPNVCGHLEITVPDKLQLNNNNGHYSDSAIIWFQDLLQIFAWDWSQSFMQTILRDLKKHVTLTKTSRLHTFAHMLY